MPRAFVLMTAMPPTTGHWQLIQFANLLSSDVTVILNTQPHEPMVAERYTALWDAIGYDNFGTGGIHLVHYSQPIEQDPKVPGFWAMWKTLLTEHGVRAGDYIVSSEPYGQTLAELMDAQFMPYDLERVLNPAKATPIRENPIAYFHEILPSESVCDHRPWPVPWCDPARSASLPRRDNSRSYADRWNRVLQVHRRR